MTKSATPLNPWLRRWHNYRSRSEWFIRWLGLPCFEGPPGLILIQIDGLSRSQLEHALARHKMPFLKRLLGRGYCLHHHYSGLPATTPACQGQLFYGVPQAVPAFSFRDFDTGEMVRMYEPGPAKAVEARLRQSSHTPLLTGGSAYVDNFTGGAAEVHFCPAAIGWGPPLRGAPGWIVGLFVLFHLPSILRLSALLVIELGLAIVDFLRGIIDGQDFFKELKFIPTRVGIVILLRELSVIGARLDATRGLPVIHMNLLGYDEQAHRRGPDSLFAHWTLKGIDAAIGRIYRASSSSHRRHYQVWIYSDHGQERVIPYVEKYGRHLDEAVSALFEELGLPVDLQADVGKGIQTLRIRWFGGRRIQRLFPVNDDDIGGAGSATLTALGPVGHLYLGPDLDQNQYRRIASGLVDQAGVPLVLVREGKGLCAWTTEGRFRLPEQVTELFGADHPWLQYLAQDWLELCHHRDAGDFVLVGWRHGVQAISFAVENGAHAGATPNETSAFALLPENALQTEADHLTTHDLRIAALKFLQRP